MTALAPFMIAGGACTGGAADATATNGGGESSDGGGERPPTVALPQAIVSARYEAGSNADCSAEGSELAIGALAPEDHSRPAQPVREGPEDDVTALWCSVVPDGSGAFLVRGAVDAGAGQFELSGTFAPSGEITGVKVRASAPAGVYEASDCVVRYPQLGGVASGRVWGQLTCAKATSGQGDACRIVAEFRFENCAQGDEGP